MNTSRIAVVGTGLIGASVGLAARRAGLHVTGWDTDPEALGVALERGALDEATGSLGEAVAGADIAVVAAPVGALSEEVRAVLAASSDNCAVTDVGSTKLSVIEAAAGSNRFVGGHPMAGSEARGPAQASADLFEGATWFLAPGASGPAYYRTVHGFVASLGATPIAIDPAAHDRLVALTSHVPHALANVVANQAGTARIDGHDPLLSGGGSLRDMTRIAGANPRLWTDILLDNAPAVGEALAEHRRRIEEVEAALARGDEAFLLAWAGEASENRRRLLERAYPDPGQLYRLQVHVADETGVLATITQALGAARINIEDFELAHISPEEGGTVTVLVTGEGEAERAVALLAERGYRVTLSAVLDD